MRPVCPAYVASVMELVTLNRGIVNGQYWKTLWRSILRTRDVPECAGFERQSCIISATVCTSPSLHSMETYTERESMETDFPMMHHGYCFGTL